ncbi:hypothetical protein [Streptomyces sp. NRRL S-118]|uniref:hypothetical protein n=1 Tax=Streptomyces sp. NRRL S-118 TaxID=1463881 RepID=UPI00131C5D99|nr:hypothetical protein [Streptomyces sp. NRRL S-118]
MPRSRAAPPPAHQRREHDHEPAQEPRALHGDRDARRRPRPGRRPGRLRRPGPGAAKASWTNVWNAGISGDYLKSHGKKWVSQGYKLPRGTNMARGVFTCWGGGNAKLKVLVLDTGKSTTKKHRCNGKKHYATIAYKRGQTVKLVLNGSKDTRVEAWAGR